MGLLRPSDEFAAKVDSSGGIATSKNLSNNNRYNWVPGDL